MEHLSVGVKNHEAREAEAAGIAQSLVHLRIVRLLLVVVDMDIDEIVLHQFVDLAVLGDEFRESGAPDAPVAAKLADNVLAALLRGFQCRVDLLERVSLFVVKLCAVLG